MPCVAKQVTLKTLAAELGISPAAVSDALHGKGNISAETTRRVRELAAKRHYSPNSIAQSLKGNRTRSLGVVIGDSSLYLMARMIEEIERVAAEMGYAIILCNAFSQVEKEKQQIGMLAGKRIDGLLLVASMLTGEEHRGYLDSMGIPYAFLVRAPEFKASYIVNDNALGARLAVSHLLEGGAKRIGCISLPGRINSGAERLAAWRATLEEAGIHPPEDWVVEADIDIASGYRGMAALTWQAQLDAVFCGCDLIAVGALQYLAEAGRRVPEDLRLAAYDDIELAAYLSVPLTTVRQPIMEIGRLGVELLVERIQRGGAGFRRVIPPELVVRTSS